MVELRGIELYCFAWTVAVNLELIPEGDSFWGQCEKSKKFVCDKVIAITDKIRQATNQRINLDGSIFFSMDKISFVQAPKPTFESILCHQYQNPDAPI
jgi:hypothetical protein